MMNDDRVSNNSHNESFMLAGQDQKAGQLTLKRASDAEDPSNKRCKSFSADPYQANYPNMALPYGAQPNIFQSDLQRAQAFAQQQQQQQQQQQMMMPSFDQLSGMIMNNSAGTGISSIAAATMERRLEEEVARHQQSAWLAASNLGGEHQFGGNNDPSSGLNADMPQRRLQGGFDSGADLLNHAGALEQMQDFQTIQGMQGFSQMTSMSAQPFFAGVLDFSLLNNRMNMTQQGMNMYNGSGSAAASGNNNTASWNQQAEQMVSMSQALNHQMGRSNSSFGHMNPVSSLGSADALQVNRGIADQVGALHMSQQQSLSMGTTTARRENSGGQSGMGSFNQQQQRGGGTSLTLPPLEEGDTPHSSQRPYSPFSIDEDPNWLSNFQCLIRSEILELFRVSQRGIKVRNAAKSLSVNQVGIRCRFCAHLQHGTRANRASCFPSKIDKIYQSFTMMLREHFPSCSEIPEDTKRRFTQLQEMNAQGASNAKGYWEHAAKKKGLVDVAGSNGRGGIYVFEVSIANAASIPPFGSSSTFSEPAIPIPLVSKLDRGLVSNFLYSLMEQTYRVHLAPSERKGNRKSLRAGMPGFGCKYCYEAGRMGLSRLFPARRRTIHTKVPDLFDHMKRCLLCPQQVKENLMMLHHEEGGGVAGPDADTETRGREREFFERIWTRLGHQQDTE